MYESDTPSFSVLDLILTSYPFWLGIVLQIVCIVHAVRTGRPFYWFFIIFFFNLIGCAVYFFLEILPDLKRGDFSFGGTKFRRFRKPSGREIKRLEQTAEYAATVQNRMLVADAYLQVGRFQEAYTIYDNCLGGAYRDDPALLWGIAQSAIPLARPEEAIKALDCLDSQRWSNYHKERTLLRARALQALGKLAESRTLYESILHGFSGEEARCHYALLLKESGQIEMARTVFQQIVDDTRRIGGSYKLREKPWMVIAKRELATLAKS
ncbi:MAG: hypothetical protein SFY80_09520 [Verrucomicrobiota bacterium]|nr:hypothetical protein [Verrucomicrobiota bacterium]